MGCETGSDRLCQHAASSSSLFCIECFQSSQERSQEEFPNSSLGTDSVIIMISFGGERSEHMMKVLTRGALISGLGMIVFCPECLLSSIGLGMGRTTQIPNKNQGDRPQSFPVLWRNRFPPFREPCVAKGLCLIWNPKSRSGFPGIPSVPGQQTKLDGSKVKANRRQRQLQCFQIEDVPKMDPIPFFS